MLISKLEYCPLSIKLKGPEGSLALSYPAWQKLLAARGAVSFPFDVNLKEVSNVISISDPTAKGVSIVEVNGVHDE